MLPTPAEIARTLATGRLLGVVHVRGHPAQLRVRHATTNDGTPMLLTRRIGDLAGALIPPPEKTGAQIVLCVDDVPPYTAAPVHGRLWLAGQAILLGSAEIRAAALAYSEINPTSDLLGVGDSHNLYRVDPETIQLANRRNLTDIAAEDFRTASPDPIHPHEPELVHHLNHCHRTQLAQLVANHTGDRSVLTQPVRALRIDRYGVTVVIGGGQTLRVPFRQPVHTVAELSGEF